jgi:Holliday junction resolvase-like predicted endonuclease
MIDLEKIKFEILKNKPIEEVIRNFNWKEFEETVAEIFRSNGFIVKQNFRFKTKRRYEIDVLAIKENLIFCVDCKKWSEGRYKKSGLKLATRDQLMRTKELKRFLKKNLIALNMLKIDSKANCYPLLVTLFEEDLLNENNCFIVPVWKLNSVLLDIESYLKPVYKQKRYI